MFGNIPFLTCRNAQAAASVANAGGGACGPTSSQFFVSSYTAVATAFASASASLATAQACKAPSHTLHVCIMPCNFDSAWLQ